MQDDLIQLKQQIREKCHQHLSERIEAAQKAIEAAQEAAIEETQTNPGDKQQAGRTMLQREREKEEKQLSKAVKLKEELERVAIDTNSDEITKGSLVVTDKGPFYVAVGLGKLKVQGSPCVAIGLESPLANEMKGKKKGDVVSFREYQYKVEEVI